MTTTKHQKFQQVTKPMLTNLFRQTLEEGLCELTSQLLGLRFPCLICKSVSLCCDVLRWFFVRLCFHEWIFSRFCCGVVLCCVGRRVRRGVG